MQLTLPLDQLCCKLAGRPRNGSYSPVVLVSCGSFNPPTNMHLRMFDLAEHALLQRGLDVLGGYVSPVNDAYGKAGLLPAKHRLAMCELATNASCVMVDGWEAQQEQYQRSLSVLQHVTQELNTHLGSDGLASGAEAADSTRGCPATSSRPAGLDVGPVRAMLLCGADLLASFLRPGVWRAEHLHQILGQHGVVCVTRQSADVMELLAQEGTILQTYKSNIVVAEEPIANAISSTAIRQELAQGRPVRYLVPDGVIKYIAKNQLYRNA